MEEYFIGVDLGGTKIYTALADSNGKILARKKILTETSKGQDIVINNILNSINTVINEAAIKKKDIERIGVGSPGPLDVDKGIIYSAHNLNYWKNVPIVEILEERTGISVVLDNDANAAALGERWFGAGKNALNMLYITISTGIGGGIVIDGEIFHGASDAAGEVGHMIIDPNGPRCGCGNPGCFEAVASGTAMNRKAREILKAGKSNILSKLTDGNPHKIDGPLIARAARAGDTETMKLWEEESYYLGIGIANLLNSFNFDLVLFGGGVSNDWDLFADKMFDYVEEYSFSSVYNAVEIKQAALGDVVGVIGAVALAMGDRLLS